MTSYNIPQQSIPTAPNGQPITQVLDRISEAFVVFDPLWRFSYLNQAAEQLLQRRREDLLGKDFWQEFPRAAGTAFHQEFHRAVEQNTQVQFEAFCQSLGLWLGISAYPSPAGLSAHAQNITERRLAEIERQRHEQQFRTLVENSPDVIAKFDREFRHLYVNRRIEQLTGRPVEQMIGKRKHELHLPAEFCNLWETKIRDAIEQRTGITFEFESPSLTGHRHYQARLFPEFGADGNVESVWSVARNITELKDAHAAAYEREQQLRAIFDNSTAAMYIKDPRGHYLSINHHFEHLFHTTREQIVGTTDYQLFPREVADALHANDLKALESQGPVEFEETIPIGGVPRSFRTVRFPLFDAAGHAYALCGMSTDITERKQAEELAAAKQAAEADSAAKDAFLAVLSHELRTPLTPILMLTSALEQQANLPPNLKEGLAAIRHNAELEARLIGDLLDATRASRGKLELRPQTLDAHSCLHRGLQMFQSDISGKRFDLTVDLKAQHHHVHADPVRLQQVFWNVIGNAVKFTPSGGRIAIHSANPHPGLLRIIITDTGIGIEAEALQRIFHAFEQGEIQITRAYGGLGLGLAISKALMEMHGGTITAASPGRGKGSTFTLELPTVPEEPAPAEAPGKPHTPAAALRILLVEDHPSTAQIMSHLLNALGHKVEVADSVHQALELAGQDPFDLIISDLALPDGSGLDLMRQIKSHYHLAGIALSGYGRPEDIEGSLEAGFDVHLTKPIDLPGLIAAIDRVCQ